MNILYALSHINKSLQWQWFAEEMKNRGVNIRVTNNSYGGCLEACGYDQATKDAIAAIAKARPARPCRAIACPSRQVMAEDATALKAAITNAAGSESGAESIMRSLEPKKVDPQMLHRNSPRIGEMLGEDDWFGDLPF